MAAIKQKILEHSLELFNQNGATNTTLRNIAQSAGISQGNLNYHYKTRQDLIEALYFELIAKMDAEMERMVQAGSILSLLYESSLISMQVLYQYRFLLRELYFILKDNENIKKHYLPLQRLRKEQYLIIFKHLEDDGLMRSEDFAGEYSRLYERMNILGDNWINAAELLNAEINNPVTYYHSLMFEVIYPYLTQSGKKHFLKLQESE